MTRSWVYPCLWCGGPKPREAGRRLCDDCQAATARRRAARRRWWAMIQRCTNPASRDYSIYGARGIEVCARWLDFDAFYADTGDRPPGRSLDRINNDGPYGPDNTRWATAREQVANQRRPRPSTICKNGLHEMAGGNLIVTPRGRLCRTCREASHKRYQAKRRARLTLWVDDVPASWEWSR